RAARRTGALRTRSAALGIAGRQPGSANRERNRDRSSIAFIRTSIPILAAFGCPYVAGAAGRPGNAVGLAGPAKHIPAGPEIGRKHFVSRLATSLLPRDR